MNSNKKFVLLIENIIIIQKRAREVIDFRISKSFEEKQIEDSVHISSKLEEHNKVNIIIILFILVKCYLCFG